ncbi:toll-interacting protein-like isoform X2 [Halichondria panicea]|uniref:toll-interacting protein-like isoform X2 n=1 Tax=Halichondria panicea TaxID=6063 RepID=UPI00312B3FE5
MATTGDSASTEAQGRQPTRRERAYLPAQLPDDFLCVEATRSTRHREPREPHLAPMTYAPQAGVPQQQVQQGPPNSVGRLKLTVSQAKLIKNYGLTRMDPYCRIRIGHTVYETPTDINGSKNPRWNKVFATNLARGVNSLYVEIFNERYLALDDRVAWAHFEFPEDLFNGETVEEWVPLNGRQGNGEEGNINIILSLQVAPPQTSYQLTAYGNQPVAMVPAQMPGAQMYYQGGYPPVYPSYPPAQVQPQPPPQQLPPSQIPQPPRIKEEEVKQLQEMFPTVDKEVVVSVLQASNGQIDQAVTNLLSMTTS